MRRSGLPPSRPSPSSPTHPRFNRPDQRRFHTESFKIPKVGIVSKLTPDRNASESGKEYLDRCLKECMDMKHSADSFHRITMIARGTVMSPDKTIREATIAAFSRPSKNPFRLNQEIAQSLTPGHISFYWNKQFLSHMKKMFANEDEALKEDIQRAIKDNHFTSFYIFQIDAKYFPGLSDRLGDQMKLINSYGIMPGEEHDNCATAVSKILFPDEPSAVKNINPLAAAIDAVYRTAEKNDLPKDDIREALILSGCTRSLHAVALDEDVARKKYGAADEVQIAADHDTVNLPPKPER